MASKDKIQLGEISGRILDRGGSHSPIRSARLALHWVPAGKDTGADIPPRFTRSDHNGRFRFERLPVGTWCLTAQDFPAGTKDYARYCEQAINIEGECATEVCVEVPIDFVLTTHVVRELCEAMVPCPQVRVGGLVVLRAEYRGDMAGPEAVVRFELPPGLEPVPGSAQGNEITVRAMAEQGYPFRAVLSSPGAPAMEATARSHAGGGIAEPAGFELDGIGSIQAIAQPPQAITGDVSVTMRRAAAEPTEDLALWVVIRKSAEALSFNNYFRFMNHVLCGEPLREPLDFESKRFPMKADEYDRLLGRRFLPFTDTEAYRLLKVATEAFVTVNCGVALDTFPFEPGDLDYVARRVGHSVNLNALWNAYLTRVNGTDDLTLPYLALVRAKLADVPIKKALFAGPDIEESCFGILQEKLVAPCLLELIWSYWHEEGMLVQTTNAIMRRFQNLRGTRSPDPLANLEIDPLRPLNNLFWGMIQDEQHRLTVLRRNYEYDHHYGLRLEGRAVRELRSADSRSKFLEAFHNLLHLCSIFFRQDDDTTVVADGFPLLNALQDVHLILSQGAHNQFGDLPSTARIEMMMQQWLLARPEFREFLPTRIMVAYPEPWMDRVDAMKKIQGWTDTSVMNFRNLAVFGEQILLSIRYGAWSDIADAAQASNWARFWRPEIQGYTHAYRSVTGVDLTVPGSRVDATLPSALLQRRLAAQLRTA